MSHARKPSANMTTTTTATTSGTATNNHSGKPKKTHIQVVVRCRGLNDNEKNDRTSSSVEVIRAPSIQGKELTLRSTVEKTYKFDRVFGPQADQELIHREIVMPILGEVLQGYNCTIFAYGQTGTGKTYTMEGDLKLGNGFSSRSASRLDTTTSSVSTFKSPNNNNINNSGGMGYDPNTLDLVGVPAEAGIIPRTLRRMFIILDRMSTEYSVRVSYIEIYNEELRDLLSNSSAIDNNSSSSSGAELKLYGDNSKKGGGVYVQGLEEVPVSTAKEAIAVMARGSERRRVAATNCNRQSSRSHAIFSIMVNIREGSLAASPDSEQLMKFGKLNLVDLAGSENIGRSGAENVRAREAGAINRSLLTLGQVINSLVNHDAHIPYRNSKLTRLLQDSLGGTTRTCLIATVSPARICLEETQSTLDYAFKAKNVCNQPEVNRQVTKSILINEMSQQLNRLKAELEATREKNGIYLPQKLYEELTQDADSRKEQTKEWAQRLELREEELKRMHTENQAMLQQWELAKEQLESTRKALGESREKLVETQSLLDSTKMLLKEQQIITAAHSQTEDDLNVTAKRLAGDLDLVNLVKSRLYEKVERVGLQEKQNLEHVSELEAKIGQMSSVMSQYVASTTVSLQESIKGLLGQLDQNVGQNFQGSLKNELEKWSAKVGEELSRTTGQAANKIESGVAIHTKAKESIDESCRSFQKAVQKALAVTVEQCQSLKKVVEDLLEDHKVKLLAISEDMAKHIADGLQKAQHNRKAQHNQTMELTDEVVKQLKVQYENVQTNHQNIDQSVNEIRNRVAKDNQDLLQTIQQMVMKQQQEQSQMLERLVGGSLENSRNINDNATTLAATTRRYQDTASSADKEATDFEASLLDAVRNRLTEAAMDAYNQATNMTTLVDQSVSGITSASGKQSQALEQFVANTNEQSQELISAVCQIKSQATGGLDSISNLARQSTESGIKLVSDAASVWEQMYQHSSEKLGQFDSQTSIYGEKLEASVGEMQDVAQEYGSKVTGTRITGDTPTRHRFPSPERIKSIRQTKPHPFIVTKIRASTSTDDAGSDGHEDEKMDIADQDDGDENGKIDIQSDDLRWTSEMVPLASPKSLERELKKARTSYYRPSSLELLDPANSNSVSSSGGGGAITHPSAIPLPDEQSPLMRHSNNDDADNIDGDIMFGKPHLSRIAAKGQNKNASATSLYSMGSVESSPETLVGNTTGVAASISNGSANGSSGGVGSASRYPPTYKRPASSLSFTNTGSGGNIAMSRRHNSSSSSSIRAGNGDSGFTVTRPVSQLSNYTGGGFGLQRKTKRSSSMAIGGGSDNNNATTGVRSITNDAAPGINTVNEVSDSDETINPDSVRSNVDGDGSSLENKNPMNGGDNAQSGGGITITKRQQQNMSIPPLPGTESTNSSTANNSTPSYTKSTSSRNARSAASVLSGFDKDPGVGLNITSRTRTKSSSASTTVAATAAAGEDVDGATATRILPPRRSKRTRS
ncbi:hypothetical protein H4219_005845 [Mycoemilia scoparia]|uniref:Kinesin motor domain-containing protein n=1 Tax=Mycoemilia scoparia TaxID=417184 RepID=A0A9W8DK94_9FUNG|nr:hypothetical protein H4219_005845 [Mycoemilia scoparia]